MGMKISGGIAAIVLFGLLSGCSTGHQCGDLVCSGGETPDSCAVDCHCGNGIVDVGEECDGTLVGDTTCVEQGLDPGPVLCSAECTFDFGQCGTSVCGNGEIEAGEQCEPGDLAGQSCGSLGFSVGDLGCSANCQFDYATCCNNQCADTSATQCNDDVVQTCVNGAVGCLIWEDATDCDATGEFCTEDEAGARCGCNDTCLEDSERCEDSLAQTCTVGENGCADWETHTDCGPLTGACAVGPDGGVCVADATGENCSDPYPLDQGSNVVGWDASTLDFTGSWPCGFAYAPDLVLSYTATGNGALEYTFHKPDSNTFVVNASAAACGTLLPSLDCQSVFSGNEVAGAFPVTSGTTYYFYIGSSFSQAPARPFVFDVRELDCTASQAVSLNPVPANGGTSTSLRPELSIDFDSVIDTSVGVITLTGDMGTNLSYDLATSPAAIGWSNNDKTLTISPTGAFPGGETITVSWTGLVDDTCGNPVAQPTWTFEIIVPPCSPGTGGVVGSGVTRIPSGFVSSPYYLAADGDWIYVGSTSTLHRYNRAAGTSQNVGSLAALTGTTHLGYQMLINGDDVFVLNEAVGQSGVLWRISTDAGATWTVEDFASLATAPSAGFRGITLYEGKLWMLTFASQTAGPQIWSVDPDAATLPAAATLEGTVTGTGSCSGLAMDDDYFYTGCDGDNNVMRISRTTYAAELLHDADEWDLSLTVNHVFADDTDGNGSADVLYVKAWYEQMHFICAPGGATPYADTLVDLSTSSAYGAAFDGTSLFFYDDGDEEIIRID